MPRRSTAAVSGSPFKLGAVLGEHKPLLRFGDYFNPGFKLPTPPTEFGHYKLISEWGALGNTEWGDCAIAGPYHAEMLWNAEAKRPFVIDTPTVLQTYSAVTGFDPDAGTAGNNPTDRGCDPHDVAVYWQNHGLPDADGNLHKITAFIDLAPGNLTQLWLATWLFSGTGVCLNMPQQWMDAAASDANAVWDVLDEPDYVGGHFVWGVGRSGANLPVVSWGLLPQITPAGYRQNNVRTLAYLSEDMFDRGVDIDGFRFEQLRADILALGRRAA